MIRRMIVLACLGCIAASTASAQDGPGPLRVWGALGLGAGVPTSGGDGIANMGQLVVQKRPHHVALRGLVLHDLARSTDEIAELGVLYGRTGAFGWAEIAVAAGVSAVAFSACPDGGDSCSTLGVPLVAEGALSGRFIGAGLQAFGNLNPQSAYAGAALYIQVGWLP